MLRYGFLILVICYCSIAQAQTNLVPNGDFEEYYTCSSFIIHLKNWEGCGSPDCFRSCNFTSPNNVAGYQYPQKGDSYVGLAQYYYFINDFREYLKIHLKKKLKKNCYYYLILYYSNADNVQYYSNEVGVLFTANDVACDISKYKLINQVPSLQNYNLMDTNSVNWMKFLGIYKAQGDEEWLIIGNFKNDAESIIYFNKEQDVNKLAYLYIDNVQLYDLCEDSTLIPGLEIKPAIPSGITLNYDGKNDYLKLMNPELFNSFRIRVFNRWGTKLYESNTPYFNWSGMLNGERVPIGVYQWQAEYTTINNPTIQYSTGNVTVLY
jgi:gliding motility-associated-like protein